MKHKTPQQQNEEARAILVGGAIVAAGLVAMLIFGGVPFDTVLLIAFGSYVLCQLLDLGTNIVSFGLLGGKKTYLDTIVGTLIIFVLIYIAVSPNINIPDHFGGSSDPAPGPSQQQPEARRSAPDFAVKSRQTATDDDGSRYANLDVYAEAQEVDQLRAITEKMLRRTSSDGVMVFFRTEPEAEGSYYASGFGWREPRHEQKVKEMTGAPDDAWGAGKSGNTTIILDEAL